MTATQARPWVQQDVEPAAAAAGAALGEGPPDRAAHRVAGRAASRVPARRSADAPQVAPGPAPTNAGVVDPPRPPSLMGPTVLAMAAGLVLQSAAVARSRAGDLSDQTQLLFWLGMLVVFVPAAYRVIARNVTTAERVVLSVALPVALQFGRLILYPTGFAFHDEFIHAATARHIASSHHLFGANSLLPVSPYYPGMEIATNGITSLTGLSTHTAAFVVLLVARVVLSLSVLATVGALTGSNRAGCLASLIYACNPQGVFFNAQYSYQSFALPLAVFTVYLLVSRPGGLRSSSVRSVGLPLARALALPLAALTTVVISHHLTAMLLVVALLAWLAFERVIGDRRTGGRGARSSRPLLAVMVGVGVVEIAAWTALPGNPILGYLRDIVTSSVTDIRNRLAGNDSHQLFHSSGGLVSPLWERVATIASILIVLVAVLPTVQLLRRWATRRQALLLLLGVVALLYPIIPLGHLTPGTGEVTDRASGFLFVGIGVAVAEGPMFRRRPRPVADSRRGRAGARTGVALALLAVVFAGGVILGAGPTVGQLPGPFLVAADARSIDSANIAAARSGNAPHLPADTRVYADRDSGLLAAAVGRLYTVTHVADKVDASRVLLAPTFTAADRDLIRRARIDYVIVDERDATGLPNQQVYIESGEYGGDNRTSPVPARSAAQARRRARRAPRVRQRAAEHLRRARAAMTRTFGSVRAARRCGSCSSSRPRWPPRCTRRPGWRRAAALVAAVVVLVPLRAAARAGALDAVLVGAAGALIGARPARARARRRARRSDAQLVGHRLRGAAARRASSGPNAGARPPRRDGCHTRCRRCRSFARPAYRASASGAARGALVRRCGRPGGRRARSCPGTRPGSRSGVRSRCRSSTPGPTGRSSWPSRPAQQAGDFTIAVHSGTDAMPVSITTEPFHLHRFSTVHRAVRVPVGSDATVTLQLTGAANPLRTLTLDKDQEK